MFGDDAYRDLIRVRSQRRQYPVVNPPGSRRPLRGSVEPMDSVGGCGTRSRMLDEPAEKGGTDDRSLPDAGHARGAGGTDLVPASHKGTSPGRLRRDLWTTATRVQVIRLRRRALIRPGAPAGAFAAVEFPGQSSAPAGRRGRPGGRTITSSSRRRTFTCASGTSGAPLPPRRRPRLASQPAPPLTGFPTRKGHSPADPFSGARPPYGTCSYDPMSGAATPLPLPSVGTALPARSAV
jgi:hypothetical protein